MPKLPLFCSLALTMMLSVGICADDAAQNTSESCGMSPRPMRVTVRHIEGNGVGYNQGYTTLEGFFSPPKPWSESWVPFLDLRGHVFNNGKMAANAGIGARYLTSSRIWGANAYYDYRDTTHQHFNQISMGFESLGQIWDFRLNGYLPVGNKISSYFQPRFAKFEGNSLYISLKRQFAMKGANAEVGAHVDNIKNAPFYFAAGPYYLEGQGKVAWGGEFRAAVDLYTYVRIEGNTSYDNVFKWIGQGQVSVNIPFGPKRKVRQGKSSSCSMALALSNRAVQRVDRNEIIPVDRKRTITKADLPYGFIFVDNKTHSNGTWESPYPTLQLAEAASSPNDVIYVLPGDGSPYVYTTASGLQLQEGQKLWGSSITHKVSTPFGSITIPALSSTMPSVQNNGSNSTVIQVGNNGEVSGMHVLGTDVSFGIYAFNVSALIQSNLVEISSALFACTGINVENFGSVATTVSILNNQISNLSNPNVCDGISVENVGTGNLDLTVSNNQISNITSTTGVSYGMYLARQGSGTFTVSSNGNAFSNITSTSGFSYGIYALNNSTGDMTFSSFGNAISNITSTTNSSFGIYAENNSTGDMSASILSNQISNLQAGGNSAGIYALNQGAGSCDFAILGNRVSNVAASGTSDGILAQCLSGSMCMSLIDNIAPPRILLDNFGGTFTLDTSSGNNIPTPTTLGSISSGTCP